MMRGAAPSHGLNLIPVNMVVPGIVYVDDLVDGGEVFLEAVPEKALKLGNQNFASYLNGWGEPPITVLSRTLAQ